MRAGGARRILFVVVSLAVLLFASAAASPASADIVIRNNPGGLIAEHVAEFSRIRNGGERVVIDGQCYSACTLVLGMIPRERLCVTQRARLGFHAAWAYAPDGSKVASPTGNSQLWDLYPPEVRSWIARRGGLTPKLMVLRGHELTAMYRACR
jgi:hypothetical protein